MAPNYDILYKAEYMKDVLYFAVTKPGKEFKPTANIYYFSIDNDLLYENYYSDFGPLNLSCVYKYCSRLNDILKCLLNKQVIVHYTSVDPSKKANAAFLLGCFGVIYLSLPPKDALRPLMAHGQHYRPFQDATQGTSAYTISLLDCLQAIKKARDLNFFNFQDFDHEEYDRLDRIQGGDLNWIIPGKFLAFIGPVDYSVSLYHPPNMYVDYFYQNNVRLVIRLNKKLYDENVFLNKGIAHCDLFFPDGSCPPRHVIFKFLQISEEIEGAIAVHCKAGLGRTGSLIGCYLIKHYRMTALEAISWMRICRPGSVIGHQQGWLQQLEPWLLKQGTLYRKRVYQQTDRLPTHKYGIYSIAEKCQNQQPMLIRNNPPSPPPNFMRNENNVPGSLVRPLASKFREGNDKKPGNTEPIRRLSPRASLRTSNKGDEKSSIFRPNIIGDGEPRPSRPLSCSSRPKVSVRTTTGSANKVPNSKNVSGFHPMPPFHVLHSPLIRSMNDARNFLLRPTACFDKQKELGSSIKVIPHLIQTSIKGEVAFKQPSQISSANAAVMTRERRNLGRSPSPSPVRGSKPVDHIRSSGIITRTNASSTQTLNLSNSRNPSNEKVATLSKQRLNISNLRPHQRESFGTASLDARRAAPKPLISSSTHSDERPLATQGDMLNSIKLQRRLRESLTGDRMTTLCNNSPVSNPFESEVELAEVPNKVVKKKRPSTKAPARTKSKHPKKSRSTNAGTAPDASTCDLFGSDSESERELASCEASRSTSAKKKHSQVFPESEEEEDCEPEPLQAAPLRSLLSRRSGSGYVMQRDLTRRGEFYIECRLYSSKDIEPLVTDPASRWKHATTTYKCAFNKNSATFKAVTELVAAAKEEMRNIHPVKYPTTYNSVW